MTDNAILVSSSEGVTIEEATQKALKDIFKSFPRFNGTKGFKYYEYDWNSQKFKDLDGNDHPENLKMAFPLATLNSYFDDTQTMMTYHVDKKFLENGLFPYIERFVSNEVKISMYYENFERNSNTLTMLNNNWQSYSNLFYSKIPILIYIGQYSGLHYFAILHTGYPATFIWLASFNPNTGILSNLGTSSLITGSWQPQSKVYTYFNSANNSLELFLLVWRTESSSLSLMKASIDLSNVQQNNLQVTSFTTVPLPSPTYLTNNINYFVFNDRNNWSIVNTSPYSRFLYFFDEPVKEVSTNTINDVLLLSFWDSVYNPTEVKIVLVPFSLNTDNNTISYYSPVEKKYNPFQLTPKIYKYNIVGEDRIYLNNINNNYEYSVDGVVSRVDNFTLILQDFNEQDLSFNVLGYKSIIIADNLESHHGIMTLDECKTSDVCATISSLYYGVGGFQGYYPIIKKHDRFLFIYLSTIRNHYTSFYNDGEVPRKSDSDYFFIILVYDTQSPLPLDYTPPTSETDIPKIARNPWFVELHHPGIEKWEFLTRDELNRPVYKNSKKVYLRSNVLVNYPRKREFSITVESLFRGDGVFYPKEFLFANAILKDFEVYKDDIVHSPFATSSFYNFYFVNLVNRENHEFSYTNKYTEWFSSLYKNFFLKYAYSPDLSSFYLGALQGDKSFPIAIFSIIDDKNPRVYKWFNIYGNITFFDAKVAFAPSRGFFTGSYILPVSFRWDFREAKISNFYPLFSIDFPKVLALYDMYAESPSQSQLFTEHPVLSFSSYFYENGVEVKIIPARRDLLGARGAFSFYFYPYISENYEFREFDSTGNFYFNILNCQNVVFIPDSSYFDRFNLQDVRILYYGENIKVGDSISMNFVNETYNYEVVDVITFSGIDVYYDDDLSVKMYLALRKE
jgi:hypothetical protein